MKWKNMMPVSDEVKWNTRSHTDRKFGESSALNMRSIMFGVNSVYKVEKAQI